MTLPTSLSAERSRAVDAAAAARGIGGPVLMEHAAGELTRLLLSLGVRTAGPPVTILCGKGNNGGDGLVMARHLHERGVPVAVVHVAPPEDLAGDAATALVALRDLPVPRTRWSADTDAYLAGSQWLVDALLGTGAKGAVRPPYGAVIDAINGSGRPVLAVDLPSGLDADRGVPLGDDRKGPAVRATHTGTFVARKSGFDRPESQAYTGLVHVLDIGAGVRTDL